MNDLIIIAIIVVVLAAASIYIYKAKKKGVKCIGCPSAGGCAENGKPKKVKIDGTE
ncbi:MAG: FeoB-associated Cys-rich membrane protein [Clostridiales bacterium]|nr:MAG: FeoB-associated Cys-rich membrane protein [Clostridiales bacterium]